MYYPDTADLFFLGTLNRNVLTTLCGTEQKLLNLLLSAPEDSSWVISVVFSLEVLSFTILHLFASFLVPVVFVYFTNCKKSTLRLYLRMSSVSHKLVMIKT